MNRQHAFLLLFAAVLIAGGAASGLRAGIPRKAVHKTTPKVVKRIDPGLTRRLRDATWRWQIVIGVRRSRSQTPLDTRAARRFWAQRARRVRYLAAHPPHKRGWLCIHRFEGGWKDSGDPYWGGLQMDRGFMRTYAPRLLLRRGLANHWTPLEQMWVAERARRSGRGYWPWPNSARFCGLL